LSAAARLPIYAALESKDAPMRNEMKTQTKSNLAVVTVVAVALLGIAAPFAIAQDIGAPTSAAGGVSAPSSPSRPSAAGPLSGTSGTSTFDSGSSFSDEGSHMPRLQPGTGKFEGPNNGTTTPCIGSTGFGSSGGIPGHKC
jgi:hypothetical protein